MFGRVKYEWKRVKYEWNLGKFFNYAIKVAEAVKADDLDLMKTYSEKAIGCGKRVLELTDFFAEEPDESFTKAMEGIEKIYNLVEKQAKSKEEEPLRRAVKRQYVQLGVQMGIVGGGKAEDFIADSMVDMYRIAADRLDDGKEILRLVYVDNEYVPEPLREVMSHYVAGEITRNDAEKRLNELKEKNESYLRDLGADSSAAEGSAMVFLGTLSAEDRLKAELYADSMEDDGQINQKKLLENIAEIVLYDEWAEMAERIGDKDPTPEELIKCHLSAYRKTFERYPIGFENEEEFNGLLEGFETRMREKKDDYFEAALQVYRTVTEKLKEKESN